MPYPRVLDEAATLGFALLGRSIARFGDGELAIAKGGKREPVRSRVHGYLPVTRIKADRADIENRIAATIRHNRARGKHGVDSMSNIVVALSRRNWSDDKIARELGMDPDEVLRLKQVSGLAELFSDREFSEAWEPTEDVETDDVP